jgi:hypothetical protein
MKRRTLVLIIAGAAMFACVACLGLGLIIRSSPGYRATATARPVSHATGTAMAVSYATEAAKPSDTLAPTATRAPTATPWPTSTPGPTATAAPTKTPVPPTATRVPPSPTPVPIGMTRDNPTAFGQSVVSDDGVEVTILKVERGQAAWTRIQGHNMFNPKPDEGTEYVLALLRVEFAGDPSKTRRVSALHFRCVGDIGAIYGPRFVVLGKEFAIELFGGGITEGEVAFQVAQGEKNLTLIYDSGLLTTARYLSLGD